MSLDILGALSAGEQAIVADAMEACGQHVQEKAANELIWRERHALTGLVARPRLTARLCQSGIVAPVSK